jgi:exo-beta-1,3-glucanase (GH17 family)
MFFLSVVIASCGPANEKHTMHDQTASELLGNPKYPAICYGGYRGLSRSEQPTLVELKDDMKILHAMGIRFLRTYNVQLPHAANVVKAISELKQEDPDFEMYVMLGAWIDCAGAWTDAPNHNEQDFEGNQDEIERAVALAQQHPDIVKVIAVGNEAMVHWAASYFVAPKVILQWVNHLQGLKAQGALPSDLWVTCSDNFASWGGGGNEYHNEDLNALIEAVDYVSMHTYPFHDTHYNPVFWSADVQQDAQDGTLGQGTIEQAMARALAYSQNQYAQVVKYVEAIDENKKVHIGETGGPAFLTGSTVQKVRGLRMNTSRPCSTKECANGPNLLASAVSISKLLMSLGKVQPTPRTPRITLACSRPKVKPNMRCGRWWLQEHSTA